MLMPSAVVAAVFDFVEFALVAAVFAWQGGGIR